MKLTHSSAKFVLILFVAVVSAFFGPSYVRAAESPSSSPSASPSASPSTSPTSTAVQYQASVSTDRAAGQVSYSVRGLDLEQTSRLTLQVTDSKKTILYTKEILLDSSNCQNGIFNGTFSISDVKYTYDQLSVNLLIGGSSISAGTCDFSIHTKNIKFTVDGNKESASRTLTLTSTESAGGVLIPGTGNQVSVLAWPNGADESTAKVIGAKTNIAGTGLAWPANITVAGVQYGTWNAKLVLTNTSNTALNQTLAKTTYEVNPVYSSLTVSKTKALEKKQSFGIYLKGFKNPFDVSKVKFNIYNSKGSQVASVNATAKDAAKTKYYAAVKLKNLDYSLDQYTIRVVVTDVNGSIKTLNITAVADERIQKGTLSVTKKKNASCTYKLTNAYIPGNIKKVQFVIYRLGSNKKKLGTYKAKVSSNKKKYYITLKNTQTGSFKVIAYGYTNWNKKIRLNSQIFRLKKKDMGKNGWYYEKYSGKKYKVYYENNVKQTDLTKELNLKKSSGSNTNKFYIEINRAACVVTVYMYDDETKKYDIPVKTCTVSVGRDVSTVAGTGGLNEHSSYTPIGTYSICSNGQSVKYSLKPMYEPDGSIVYARWASHIVGNVYFHSVAVGSQSHYALSAYNYNRLGSPASAGCVRMTVADAKWIYDYASAGSTVKIVKGNSSKPGPLGKNKTIKINGVSYDPTDPAVPNSRKKADYKAGRISGYMKKNGKKVGY